MDCLKKKIEKDYEWTEIENLSEVTSDFHQLYSRFC